MKEEIDALSQRITDLVDLVRSLREENQRLRTELADARHDLANSVRRVECATKRLDALIEQIPDDVSGAQSGFPLA